MAFAVWTGLKTEGTTAISNIVTETKQAIILSLPVFVSNPRTLFSASNKAAIIPAYRWRIKKG
jgi:hypothetical protein